MMINELLAPAGNKESFMQAVNNGADAVYIAGKNYGARAYAPNFSLDELCELIGYAHTLNVKVYVTVNTVIKNNELNDCISFIEKLYKAGVDAIIIQDLGLAHIIRKMFPSLRLHASTQMNCKSVKHASDLANLGFKRVILARETPIEVIKDIIKNVDIEVEVFVHGALCMSYSGNCYFSSVVTKRSGNRGRCAQQCRLAYKLASDEDTTRLPKRYYLSPRDLCELDNMEELKKIGITSFKIEGRMKRPEYVGLVTRCYRKAIDERLDQEEIDRMKKDIAVMFNRTFTKGYLFNESNKHFTNISTSNHIGIKIGKVTRFNNGYVFIKLDEEVRSGDSIRILSVDNDAITINEMFVNGVKGVYAKAGDLIQIRCHKEVDKDSVVLKTSDAKLIEEINNTKQKKIYLDAKLYLDEVATLDISDGINKVSVKTTYPYEAAKSSDIKSRQIEQLKKTSDTIYKFRNIEIVDNIFLPIKEINELRRNALEAINNIRKGIKDCVVNKYIPSEVKIVNSNEKHMFFKVRTKAQLEACINLGVKDILVDDPILFKGASNYKLLDDELNIILIDKRINDNSIYNKKIVDVYSNVMNYATVRNYLENGCEIIGMSIEASRDDVLATIKGYNSVYGANPNLLVMVYGYYELMIMKHCMINKSLGLDSKGCNKCYLKQYYLVDRLDYHFPLINDGNCNLKMLNCKRLHLINQIGELLKMGVNNLLVDVSIEDDYEEVISDYLNAFNSSLEGEEYYPEYEYSDVTYGHYKEGVE